MAIGNSLRDLNVQHKREEQPESHRVCYESQRTQNRAENPVNYSPSPRDRSRKKGESHREIEIHETGIERETVRDDRDGWSHRPGDAPSRSRYETKGSPEERQHAGGDYDFFGARESQARSEPTQAVVD